ncbi:hypothetical protein DAPPUDRAFT_256485 [Daphnia pulex]|uniref:Uncharacterized protein n=1 Tax=Daphnia pulex TaxID=6669 RepID=E9HBG5_DAPPU|nr:hypothetical protein DAPPUDRAFT_256485 [Daphnia pulex]|eukprot:EFX70838.1 hypothetical protein DAPPUDRAFT_256485 [Daphnia pulex]
MPLLLKKRVSHWIISAQGSLYSSPGVRKSYASASPGIEVSKFFFRDFEGLFKRPFKSADGSSSPSGLGPLTQLHAQVYWALEDAIARTLYHGYSLLDMVARSHPGAEGIRKTEELIKNDNSSWVVRAQPTWRRASKSRRPSLHSWLSEVIGGFLKTHIDMRIRRKEIESLLRSVTSLCEMDEFQTYEVQMKGDVLQAAGLGHVQPDPTDGETKKQ